MSTLNAADGEYTNSIFLLNSHPTTRRRTQTELWIRQTHLKQEKEKNELNKKTMVGLAASSLD